MSSEAPSGKEAVIFLLPCTSSRRSRSRVCSLSLIVTDSTLPSSSWVSATEVGTSWYPPLPRNRDENVRATRTTRTTQNHTERKIFLRSIHPSPRPDYPAAPSTLLIVRGRRLRLGRAPRRWGQRRRDRRYTGAPVQLLPATSELPVGVARPRGPCPSSAYRPTPRPGGVPQWRGAAASQLRGALRAPLAATGRYELYTSGFRVAM